MEVVFQTSAVRHLEVVSRDEVIKTLVEAFKNANLGKQTAVIALSDHIIFEKLISQNGQVPVQKEIADFYHDVPLDEEHIAKKIMPLKGSALALAANRELYSIVVEVAHEFEWKIKAVIPMTPFAKLREDQHLTPEQVGLILAAEDIFKEADFLKESLLAPEIREKVEKGIEGGESRDDNEDAGDDEEDTTKSGSKAKTAIIIFLILFLFSFITGSLIYFKIINLPFNVPFLNESSVPAVSAPPEASQSAVVAPIESTPSANVQEASVSAQINKEDVRIHVLNGSGIAGQAAVIKEKLVEKGYTNVITGNIEGAEASRSSVTYSKVEQGVKNEINELMDSLIGETEKLEEALNEFSLRIVIGKLDGPIQ